jgi:hypothetical protein
LELGVGPRRWIGRLRLHAGKYILGITAPTGTGVQAGSSRESVRFPPISPVCCGVYVIHAQAIKRTCCFHPPTCYVRFSTRPVGVKRFQTIHCCSVDVARGLVLLSGIGSPAFLSFCRFYYSRPEHSLFCATSKIRGFTEYQCPRFRSSGLLLALSGHRLARCTCPLSGVKRTSAMQAA